MLSKAASSTIFKVFGMTRPGIELGFPGPLVNTLPTMSRLNKLATLVEGDQKAPFSIAPTPKCREGHYLIPRIAPIYPWSSPYNVECLARQHQVPFFESLVWLDLGLNLGVGVFFLSLMDECMLRAFSQTFSIKNFLYLKLLRECLIYLNSSSQYCGLHILMLLTTSIHM